MPQINRILVTGGAGFLGSHLCERLVDEGHDVICVDNFFTSQKTNVAHLLDRPNFDLIRHDVTQPLVLEVDRDLQPGLPGRAGPLPVQPDQDDEDLGDGRDQHARHGQALPGENPAGLDQRSVRRSRGPSAARILPRRGEPVGPRACYDEGKRAAETLFMDYHRMHQLNVRIVRIFNTYGPRMHPYDGRVVSNFIRQALRGEDITIFGDGSQTRSFCYRDDLIEGMHADDERPGRFHRAGEPRQPGRVHDPGTGEAGDRADRQPIEDRPQGLAGGRPHAAPAGHHAGQAKAGLAAARRRCATGLEKTIAWFRTIRWEEYRAPTPNY